MLQKHLAQALHLDTASLLPALAQLRAADWCSCTASPPPPRLSSAQTRSGLFSTFLLVGYIGSMLLMLGIGAMAIHCGRRAAVSSFCVMVIAVCALCAPLLWRHQRIRQASAPGTAPCV